MKKLFLLSVVLCAALAAAAKPIMVGHRGSGYGVESTEEAFRRGAELGYEYVESDVKVTGDRRFVLSHDDDTKRLGGTKTIATSTLEELQSETLTQTRSGVTYTGRIASLDEWLTLCDELNIKPLIELKWATGINNNDCSNIPLLIKTIEDLGYRNKCIILTSMKPCLEYIRKNYPDITLQFLTGQYWANHFDWCVQWGIDVDIQATYFDSSTVERFHDEGLKVNMWTTNDNAGYLNYGNMGCDFITTDRLDAHNLPELDESVLHPENTVDFPRLNIPVKGSYTPTFKSSMELPAEVAKNTVVRAVYHGENWAVISKTQYGNMQLHRVNAATGKATQLIADGQRLADISFNAEGSIVGAFNDPTAETLKFTQWTEDSESSTVIGTLTYEALGGTPLTHIGVSGRKNDLRLFIPVESESGTRHITVVTFQGTAMKELTMTEASELIPDGNFSLAPTPFSRDNIILNKDGVNTILDVQQADGHIITSVGKYDGTATSFSFLRRSIKIYAMTADAKASFRLYEANASLEGLLPATPQTESGLDASGFCAAAIAHDSGSTYIHLLTAPGGLATYLLDTLDETPEPSKIEPLLEQVWIQSRLNGNAPDHIDGTYARQGTAVNGVFYVNNSNDGLLYIFNKEGLVGSLKGGKGYGCARDDAGNIIIRDENSSSANHTLLIYGKGVEASLESNEEVSPASYEITLPLAGQADFISASGDVLEGSGIVYIWPKDKNQACMVLFDKGTVTGIKTSGSLSIQATAAGYIIPRNDNSESWYYHVRSSGTYLYDGGINSQVFTAKSSTTPPARNTTGGAAFANLGNNLIMAHSSGKNYIGGFTLRNLSTDEVITTIDPIGDLGYTSGGNYSTFNWLFFEQVQESEYNLYLFCPSNGIAMYRLTDKLNSGIKDVTYPSDAQLVMTIEGETLSAGEGTVDIYSVSGQLVARGNHGTADISSLNKGIYIVRTESGTAKFIR